MHRRTPVVVWLAGTALSLAGTQAMGFALVWFAAAHGGWLAALTLTATVLPRVLFLLPGGALSDRLGAWRVLVGADVAAALGTLVLALLLTGFPASWWPIPLAALVGGLADAVYLPASATVPRLLTEDAPGGSGLSRTMAARQIAGQTAALAGPALGGLLVTTVGLVPVVAANAATFAAMAVILIRLRPLLAPSGPPGLVPSGPPGLVPSGPPGLVPSGPPGLVPSSPAGLAPPGTAGLVPPGAAGFVPSGAAGFVPSGPAGVPLEPAPVGRAVGPAVPGTGPATCGPRGTGTPADRIGQVSGGLRVVLADPVLRQALVLTAVAAGFLLPVSGLLLPLLARARGWPATHTGLLAAALAAGTGGVALIVLIRGARRRPGPVAVAGLLTAAAGVAALAAGDGLPQAVAAALVIGVGSGVFATHLGPLFLSRAPRTHLARTQSVLVLAQSLPLLATQNLFGAVAGPAGVPPMLMICALVLALASGLALRSGPLRAA